MASVEVDESILVKFAQKLASNESRIRNQAVKKLRKWIGNRSQVENGGFTEEDLMKIWKGLHYCMWMADKPLVQEDLAENLSQLTHSFQSEDQAFIFIRAFFLTECREWFGTDRLRLDKFMMLIRRVLRQSFVLLKKKKWKKKHIRQLTGILEDTAIKAQHDDETPDGLKFHMADIYLDELESQGANELSAQQTLLFLQPYMKFIHSVRNRALCRRVIKRVFFRLIDYAVEIASKMAGEDDDEEEEDEESEETEKINVLNVDYETIADELFKLGSSTECYGKNRKDIYSLVKTFRDLAQGILPEEEQDSFSEEDSDIDVDGAVTRLSKFEKDLAKKTNRKEIRKEMKRKRKSLEDDDGPLSKKSKSEGPKNKNKFKTEAEKKKKDKKKKKKAATSNAEDDASMKVEKKSGEELMFVGGFEDSDDEDTSKPMVTENNVNSNTPSEKSEEDSTPVSDGGLLSDKKSKKKGKKSKDIVSPTKNVELESNVSPKEKSPKSNKKKQKNTESVLETSQEEVTSEKCDVKVSKQSSSDDILASILNSESPHDDGSSEKKGPPPFKGTKSNENLLKDSPKDKSEAQGKKASSKKKGKSEPSPKETLDTLSEPSVKKKKIEANLFEGGYFDSDEENSEAKDTNTNVKKKDKRRSLPSTLEPGVKPGKKGKKNSRKSLDPSQLTKPVLNGLSEASEESDEKSDKTNPEGETEIWVPNKKYKGKLKEAAEKAAQEVAKQLIAETLSPKPSKSAKSSPQSGFAKFEPVPAPVAFVKRAMAKVEGSKKASSAKKAKAGAEESPQVGSAKKRVSFVMSRNMAQGIKEFRQSLKDSPVLPFNPDVVPSRGILSPATTPAKLDLVEKKKKRRASASDFF